eukprot:scaffold2820_cov160-Amphora_coffeaeformis.AAC.3
MASLEKNTSHEAWKCTKKTKVFLALFVVCCLQIVATALYSRGSIVPAQPAGKSRNKQPQFVAKPPIRTFLVDGKPFLVNKTRPPYGTLIQNCSSNDHKCKLETRVTALASIIDYAILGFAKCGTTTMGQILGRIAQAPTGDTCRDVTEYIHHSYKGSWGNKESQYGNVPARGNQQILTGVKCPAGIELKSIIKSWSHYQPETLLIIGIRHPVLAFQSFYNMFVQNGWNFRDPHDLIPSCGQKNTTASCSSRGCPNDGTLCVDRLRFHVSLAKLGKTPLKDPNELQLLPLTPLEQPRLATYNISNKVFLYEVSQLTDSNEDRRKLFWSDLSNLLDLPFDLDPGNEIAVKPGERNLEPHVQAKRDQRKIDICSATNDVLRAILMGFAEQCAEWICQYFLQQERNGVFVSSREHFCDTIMASWKVDPCTTYNATRL